jgi:hypothetical protein
VLALRLAVGLPGAGQGWYGGGAGGRGQRFQEGAAGKSLQHDGGILSAIVVPVLTWATPFRLWYWRTIKVQ